VNATTAGFCSLPVYGHAYAGQKDAEYRDAIQIEQQQVQVEAEAPTVDTSPDQNANAIVSRQRFDALSDDPDELESQLQALAGPAAGPNGGEIYIDGFTGGQIRRSPRSVRSGSNQNPFSADFDSLGMTNRNPH